MEELKEVKLGEILKKMTGFDIPFEEIYVKLSLIEDIRLNGIRVPLKFIERPDGHLRIMRGVHRLVSAVRLGFDTIPVIIINESKEV